MAAKIRTNYLLLDELVLLDDDIRTLIEEGGYEAFGIYIAFLTTIRKQGDQMYRVPRHKIPTIAKWDLHMEPEKLSDALEHMIDIGLLDGDEDAIWSNRRCRDLLKQDEAIEQKRRAGEASGRSRGSH